MVSLSLIFVPAACYGDHFLGWIANHPIVLASRKNTLLLCFHWVFLHECNIEIVSRCFLRTTSWLEPPMCIAFLSIQRNRSSFMDCSFEDLYLVPCLCTHQSHIFCLVILASMVVSSRPLSTNHHGSTCLLQINRWPQSSPLPEIYVHHFNSHFGLKEM